MRWAAALLAMSTQSCCTCAALLWDGLQEFGDGIMSAIDMFATIDTIEGKLGEKRMVITLNGKVGLDVILAAAAAAACNFANALYEVSA